MFMYLFLLINGISSAQEPERCPCEQVVLQLKWYHQFQFAGYYAAVEMGFYQEAGLSVKLVEGGPRDTVGEVICGRADYGTTNAGIIFHRLHGDPVVVLATLFQHSPLILMMRRDSGITNLQDMIGRSVRMSVDTPRHVEFLAAFRNEGVHLNQIKILPEIFKPDDYFKGTADAIAAYITNEPFFLTQKGIPVTIIRPSTYGIDFYGDCLFTSEKEIATHPDRVKRFLDASLMGWEYAMTYPEKIINLILAKYSSAKTREHLRYEAEKMRELIMPDIVEIGHINPGRWKHIADTFVRLKMTAPDYSLEGFIYNPNPEPDYTWVRRVMAALVSVLLLAGTGLILLLIFNRTLKTAVTKRTSDLLRLNEKLIKQIRERKQAEISLRNNFQFLEALLDTIPNPIFYKDRHGIYTGCNKAFAEEILGLSREKIIGHSVYDLPDAIPGNFAKTYHEADMKLMQTPGIQSYETDARQADGKLRNFHVYKATFSDTSDNVAGIVGILLDISDHKRMEEELKRAGNAARTASKAKSEFISRMSHELRTPMNIILGMSHIIMETELTKEQSDCLKNIDLASRELSGIINDILDFSKIGTRKLEIKSLPFRLDKVLEDVFTRFSPGSLKKRLEIRFEISENVPVFLIGDPIRLGQILRNLTDNAIKFTETGSVTLNVNITETQAGPDHQEILFSVEDTGIGISPERLSDLFEPFTQGDGSLTRKHGGIGLGLTITRELVEMMDGEIWAESEPGQGSLFCFTAIFGLDHDQKNKKDVHRSFLGQKIVSEVSATSDTCLKHSPDYERLMAKLEVLLIECDANSSEYVTRIKECLGDSGIDEQLERLESQVDDFEFEEARKILDEIAFALNPRPI